MRPLRVAVIGAGVFGANHVRVLRQISAIELVGVLDTDWDRACKLAVAHEIVPLASTNDLQLDAAIVATPTSTHEAVASRLIETGVDVLVEKPIAASSAAGERLAALAQKHGRILQVGHLERFNPAVIALEKAITVPLFFEVHRMSPFTPRSLDVDVVLDLMIHDLDIVLSLLNALPDEIRAAGISVLSPKVDIANVRLAFPSGCVANLTASRVSIERVRKLRLFQPSEYISLDYQRQDAVRVAVNPGRQIGFEPLPITPGEPLRLELESFLESVRNRTSPRVGALPAASALRLAENILDKIEEHSRLVAHTLHASGRS